MVWLRVIAPCFDCRQALIPGRFSGNRKPQHSDTVKKNAD